jgi:hypothetical protein
MGFYFRRSVGVGPFRINLSKSGVGWSVGGRGFRTGVSARGRRYTTFGLPGTGLGYRSYGRQARGCALPFLIGVAIPLLLAGGAALAAARGVLASLTEGT